MSGQAAPKGVIRAGQENKNVRELGHKISSCRKRVNRVRIGVNQLDLGDRSEVDVYIYASS